MTEVFGEGASEVQLHDEQHEGVDQSSGVVKERYAATTRARKSWLTLLLLLTAAFGFVLVETSHFVKGGNESKLVDYLNTRPGVKYVGDEPCRQCHVSQYESFKRTGMGRSMSRPGVDKLGISGKPVTLRIERDGRVYSVYVRNGKMFHRESQLDSNLKPLFTQTHEVAYVVGSGDHGRSYLIAQGDFLYLSPLSFYTGVRKWDLSPGYEAGLYRDFTRPVGGLCVSCHSGLSQPVPGTVNQYRQPAFSILAIGCERCHGPGALHVAERRAAKAVDTPFDRSIVNPKNLEPRLRDDVCYQCHLAGDARVQSAGKTALDFRPGTLLNDAVAIFLVPPKLKVGGFQALSQPEQIHMSRCRQTDGTTLNCISCHDPHVQKVGPESSKLFDSKCVKCHTSEDHRFALAHRLEKTAGGSCVACHMPKVKVTNIAHTALTDHRIPKNPKEADRTLEGSDPDPLTNLIWVTRPPEKPDLDLRTLALAFAKLAPDYPGYGERGLPLLQRAAREFPNDPDVQITYGEVLLVISPDFRASARKAFERAISLGSKSTTVRRRLADLMLQEGDKQGIELLREAIMLEPYNAATYLQLARVYREIGKRLETTDTLKRVLSFDPGNADARLMLEELQRQR